LSVLIGQRDEVLSGLTQLQQVLHRTIDQVPHEAAGATAPAESVGYSSPDAGSGAGPAASGAATGAVSAGDGEAGGAADPEPAAVVPGGVFDGDLSATDRS